MRGMWAVERKEVRGWTRRAAIWGEFQMTATKDPFRINIVLRHPSYSPENISEALSLKPVGSWGVGQRVVETPAKRSYFSASLEEGDDVSDFDRALANVTSFLEKHAAFWTDFTGGDGEVELILNHTIYPQDEEGDKCFELYLAPAFLAHPSTGGIGLRVQGWQRSIKTEELASTSR
jgi:hypothetical protein